MIKSQPLNPPTATHEVEDTTSLDHLPCIPASSANSSLAIAVLEFSKDRPATGVVASSSGAASLQSVCELSVTTLLSFDSVAFAAC